MMILYPRVLLLKDCIIIVKVTESLITIERKYNDTTSQSVIIERLRNDIIESVYDYMRDC